MRKIYFIIFLLYFCLIITVKGIANGSLELAKVNDAIIQNIDKRGFCSPVFLQLKLRPLLYKCFAKTKIWSYNSNIKGVPAFRMFLRPMIKNDVKSIPNPYVDYAIGCLLFSKYFKEGGIKLQKETCLQLLKNYLSAKEYKIYHEKILRTLVINCHNKKYYNNESVKIIEDTIVKNKIPANRYLLLLWIIDKKLNPQTVKILKLLADNCYDFQRKNLTSWLALIYLAQNNEKKYLDQLIGIVKQANNTQQGIRKARYMFPYVAMVQKPEIVELMRTFLKNKTLINQGNDVIPHYTGVSFLAAQVLYGILDGYVKFSLHEFTQDERKKCLDWFKNNKLYKLKKVEYWASDLIIFRMRYMVFNY